MLDPTEAKTIKPKRCSWGNTRFPELEPYYTHQFIELPDIHMEVTHFVLHKGECPCCGKVNQASLPREYRAGFGARLSAMIAQLAGNQGDSRTLIQEFCTSVLGFPISLGPSKRSSTVVPQPVPLIMKPWHKQQGRAKSLISMGPLFPERMCCSGCG